MYSRKTNNDGTPQIKLPAVIAASVILTACGGGGSGSDSSGPSLSNEVISLEVGENTERTVSLEGNIESTNITRSSAAITFDATPSESSLTITVSDIVRNHGDARIEIITSTDKRYIVNVVAENTSAAAVLAEAATLSEITSGTALVQDDVRLANVALELKYLASQSTYSEKVAAQNANAATIGFSASNLMQGIETLKLALADYEAGDITETQLSQSLDATKAEFTSLDQAAGELVNDARVTINNLIDTDLPIDIETTYPVEYVAEADRYSRYMNEDFGTLSNDGSYSFNPEYDYLNSVFAFASSAAR